MTRFIVTSLLVAMSASSNAFVPQAVPFFANRVVAGSSKAESENAPVETAVIETTKMDAVTATTESPPAKSKAPAKKAPGHKEGLLSPFVILAKRVLGDDELNQLRGKIIGLHSEVIGSFVDTYDSKTGDIALKALFELADADKSGSIEEKELAVALRTLGFDLKEKQIKGIFERADKDANGSIDYEEWRKEAPKTLRTNLIKLAKRNGADLGFLS
jgi:hypothetical protein